LEEECLSEECLTVTVQSGAMTTLIINTLALSRGQAFPTSHSQGNTKGDAGSCLQGNAHTAA